MELIAEIAHLRAQVALWRLNGEKIALVPTMGNLHDGHLKLVAEARQRGDRCVATIFVNPLQFGEGEDFDSYPRTLQEDAEKLQQAGVDLLFAPSVEVVYPAGQAAQSQIEVPLISDILCGASRPGHFVGVATVVAKLFNLVQPDMALFGEKDFQQLMVIRWMTRDLCFPIEIIGVTTDRETDGLARSSRNGYLTADERELAPALYAVLNAAAEELQDGEGDLAEMELSAANTLKEIGFESDYFTIRRAADLQRPESGDTALVILAAAYLGRARLIDNITLTL
ncbi:MAG: pantoate--beta-alanine ligase [Candidatus Polarisedimenticolaceae bacterium]|nr:pantoate--beta-alanine ligase [Candidatus Polarisedimenticolaceae bacterium]